MGLFGSVMVSEVPSPELMGTGDQFVIASHVLFEPVKKYMSLNFNEGMSTRCSDNVRKYAI